MSTGPRPARVQRQALADLLIEYGPGHPTLCAGWTNHDLAAHLVTRERIPWAAPGLVISRLHGITERAERSTMRAHPYPALVDALRAGPPWWQPTRFGPLDDAANLVEFFIHAEDIRRSTPRVDLRSTARSAARSTVGSLARSTAASSAEGSDARSTVGAGTHSGAGTGADWKPRELDDASRNAMWNALRLAGFAGFRRAGVGVIAERTDRPGRRTLHGGDSAVEIVGLPEEILLFAFGRGRVAQVDLRGTTADIDHLRCAPIGL
ncbi:TIGR03085 family metal-binding protein [Frankia sp. R82]|uniref:TIGR03085 family metal-binding protein n=1 Tax=Frankia sp. R82 TaxID=2950553 RepID=UPI00204378A4|nr:TIGR03085 family metal-binding protein [Frankia sp. R82]MCM3886229.1 TIGR03085 family metal-binding protein [Frankia sp. R82]